MPQLGSLLPGGGWMRGPASDRAVALTQLRLAFTKTKSAQPLPTGGTEASGISGEGSHALMPTTPCNVGFRLLDCDRAFDNAAL
jgi:hypothetical protein